MTTNNDASWNDIQGIFQDLASKTSASLSLLHEKLEKTERQSENHLKEVQAELYKALQEVSTWKQEINKLSSENYSTSKDLVNAKEVIDQLFYAVQLLTRGLRSLRIKAKELKIQKEFLSNQNRALESIHKEIFELVKLMVPQLKALDPSPKRVTFRGKKVSCCHFKAAVIAVVAARRVAKRAGIGYGKAFFLGKEKMAIAPKKSIQHIRDIPQLPNPSSEFYEAEGLNILLNHFDPPSLLEDQLHSRSLLYGLNLGLREFEYWLKKVLVNH